jgi:hypothetical protein
MNRTFYCNSRIIPTESEYIHAYVPNLLDLFLSRHFIHINTMLLKSPSQFGNIKLHIYANLLGLYGSKVFARVLGGGPFQDEVAQLIVNGTAIRG